MRKLSSKKKMRKSRSKDEESPGSPESSVNLEANENGGKNEDESSDSESDNSKTVKRKSRKNATAKKKIVDDDKSANEDAEDDGAEQKDDENGDGDEKNDGEEEYEVQDIVDEKEEKGVTYFLIRWKGYGPNDDTWEAEDTLSCPDIIARFQKKKKSGGGRKAAAPKSKKAAAASKQPKAKKRKLDQDDEDAEPADPEKEWEVARIINVGYDKGVRLFQVRWKGYRPKDDTWEPEENLNCHDLIDKFLKDMERTNKADQKELREQPQRTQRFGGDSYRRGSKRNAGKSRTVYYEEDD